jgi:hypothetical protein
MSLVRVFEQFGPQLCLYNQTFPEQKTSLLDSEGLSVSVEPFELCPMLAEKCEVWPARLDEFLY